MPEPRETKFSSQSLKRIADDYKSTDNKKNLIRWAMDTFHIPRKSILNVRPHAVVYIENDH